MTDAEIIDSNPSFAGLDNYGSPRINYVRNLSTKSDEELIDEGETKIWLSAFAANNRRSDYHWHVTAIYNEMSRRDPSGHMYNKAYRAAFGN